MPTIDEQPRARLRDTLVAQGVRPDQLVTFITDGADDLASLTEHLNLTAEYILDWFHIAMRFTVLANTATNLTWIPDTADDPDLEPQSCAATVERMRDDIGRAKWFLWHGNLHRSLQVLDDVQMTLECLRRGGQPAESTGPVGRSDPIPGQQPGAYPELRRTSPQRRTTLISNR